MAPNKLTTVVWDGDNTLWDWMKYAVPAYEAMCSEIAGIAGKSEEETAEAMKAFYTEKGTLEDAGLMQGLSAVGFFEGVEGFDLRGAVLRVQRVFSKVRTDNLEVYEGIRETLEKIKALGVWQIILTDAPLIQVNGRLAHTGLYQYFSGIYAMRASAIPSLPEDLNKWRAVAEQVGPQTEVPHEKPYSGLEEIVGMNRARIVYEVGIVGDNGSKDMALARKYRCVGVHALYGSPHADLGPRLQKFAPDRVAGRNMQVAEESSELEARPAQSPPSRIRIANSPAEIFERLFEE